MATYNTMYDKAHNSDFINRVEMALVTAALAITKESTLTANHANRNQLAREVLFDPARFAKMFSIGLASESLLQGTSSDADILTTINADWNSYAGLAVV